MSTLISAFWQSRLWPGNTEGINAVAFILLGGPELMRRGREEDTADCHFLPWRRHCNHHQTGIWSGQKIIPAVLMVSILIGALGLKPDVGFLALAQV